jgi:hypothetical protein
MFAPDHHTPLPLRRLWHIWPVLGLFVPDLVAAEANAPVVSSTLESHSPNPSTIRARHRVTQQLKSNPHYRTTLPCLGSAAPRSDQVALSVLNSPAASKSIGRPVMRIVCKRNH